VVVAPKDLGAVPWRTLALASAALAAYWLPGAADALVYDRSAVATGELWRLLTAHWVHFSGSHLLSNLAVLVATGWLIEARDRGDSLRLFAVAALSIGIVLFVAQPELRIFGGASGVAYAFVTYLALCGLRDAGRRRWLCAVLLAVAGAKLLAEQVWGWNLVARDPDAGFVAVPLSHVAGIAAGTGLWLWKLIPRVPRRPRKRDHVAHVG
jgi:rhomboid family GlyGly-CTERM serine protease